MRLWVCGARAPREPRGAVAQLGDVVGRKARAGGCRHREPVVSGLGHEHGGSRRHHLGHGQARVRGLVFDGHEPRATMVHTTVR